MKQNLVELRSQEIIGLNKSLILKHNEKHGSFQKHIIVRANDLDSCVAGIFMRDLKGYYYNFPIEKIAGLLLYRVSQGQCFFDGNKRTSVLAMKFFLFNNDYNISIQEKELEELLWGFAIKKYNGRREMGVQPCR